ncbi:hypothetical protein BDV11DRAFT_138031 [Aspergillus similis]
MSHHSLRIIIVCISGHSSPFLILFFLCKSFSTAGVWCQMVFYGFNPLCGVCEVTFSFLQSQAYRQNHQKKKDNQKPKTRKKEVKDARSPTACTQRTGTHAAEVHKGRDGRFGREILNAMSIFAA